MLTGDFLIYYNFIALDSKMAIDTTMFCIDAVAENTIYGVLSHNPNH